MSKDTLEARVGKLERQNRRLKRVGLGVIAAVGAALLLGQARAPRTVTAESFVLLDTAGRVRAELGSNKVGEAYLLLRDAERQERVALQQMKDGAALVLRDANGRMAVMLSADKVVGPGLYLHDPKGRGRTALALSEAIGSYLSFTDANDKIWLLLEGDEEGGALSLNDGNGKTRLLLEGDKEGGALSLRDGNGKIRLLLEGSEKRVRRSLTNAKTETRGMCFRAYDANGRDRASFGMTNDGGAYVRLRDADGKMIWSAPQPRR